MQQVISKSCIQRKASNVWTADPTWMNRTIIYTKIRLSCCNGRTLQLEWYTDRDTLQGIFWTGPFQPHPALRESKERGAVTKQHLCFWQQRVIFSGVEWVKVQVAKLDVLLLWSQRLQKSMPSLWHATTAACPPVIKPSVQDKIAPENAWPLIFHQLGK